MKSVKPGRGPSAMGAMGSIAAVIFGIFWTVMATSMGAPVFFPIFGVIFIVMGIVQALYHFKNATGENRYSEFDIVDSAEEPDPWDQRFGANRAPETPPEEPESEDFRYCPYCGARLGSGFTFCGKCGKRLPDTE